MQGKVLKATCFGRNSEGWKEERSLHTGKGLGNHFRC